ncbi:MAG TPA: polysaccharide deacetylase family protein [Chthoniobacteraceae bacterium]|nr:polysaccharide deacetylase family protein [Chthoniobacteraceae bacterium]
MHRIVRESQKSIIRDNRALELTPESLRSILAWVRKRGLDVIRLDEVRNRLGAPRGPKFICFTFDDGYRDNLMDALPIFREFGFSFTVNVTTGFINRTASAWWYTLEDAILAGSSLEFTWGGEALSWSYDSVDARDLAFVEIASLIRSQGAAARDALIAEICRIKGLDPMRRTSSLMMDWGELTQLAADYHVTIGAHSVGHHVLSQLSEEELEGELIDAKAELEARLGKPIQHLAYPFGGRDAVGAREFTLARECDYLTAVTTRNGNLFQEHAWHLQALPRLGIDGNHVPVRLLHRLESGLVPARGNRWRRLVVD